MAKTFNHNSKNTTLLLLIHFVCVLHFTFSHKKLNQRTLIQQTQAVEEKSGEVKIHPLWKISY